jgi:hypothetical protein
MDDLRRRGIGEENPAKASQDPTTKNPFVPVPTRTKSVLRTVLYILHQILDLSVTAVLLGLGFILPELKDSITSFDMGKKFDPERDIGSLEGRVIMVTGGTQPPSWPHTIRTLY